MGCTTARPPTSLRPVLLRLALVVEAHGALVHAVGLHAVFATETTRVVWGDRVAAGRSVSGQNATPLKAAGVKRSSSAPGDKGAQEAARGAARRQTGRVVWCPCSLAPSDDGGQR